MAEQIATVFGIIAGSMIVIGPILKWLLSDWHKKAKELEELKKQQVQSAMERFKRDVDSLGVKLRAHEQKLISYEKTAIRMQSNIETVMSLLDSSFKSAEKVSENLEGKIQQQVRSEVLKLKDHLIMIREKRDGAT